MAHPQKTVLRNSFSLNLSWGLLAIIVCLFFNRFIMNPIGVPTLGTLILKVIIIALILGFGLRNFLFQVEIKEEGLQYRNENGKKGMIPWTAIKKFSTRRSIILKRRLDISWEDSGKPRTLSIWAVTAWQNPEFIQAIVEKTGLTLPENWESCEKQSVRLNSLLNYIIGGIFLAVLCIHLVNSFIIYKTPVFYVASSYILYPLNLFCLILLVAQILISSHINKPDSRAQYLLAFLFFILNIPYLSLIYWCYQFRTWDMLSFGVPGSYFSLSGIFLAVTIGACLFAGLYPFRQKVKLFQVKSLLPASILTGFLFWFIPITLLPPASQNPSQSLGKMSPRLNVIFNDGSIGIGGTVYTDKMQAVFTTSSSFGSNPQVNILQDSQKETIDSIEGASLSPDKKILLIEGTRSSDTTGSFRVVFRYDSINHTMKVINSHPEAGSMHEMNPVISNCWLIKFPSNSIWSKDSKKAAFFRSFGYSRVTTLIPEKMRKNPAEKYKFSDIPVLLLMIYDRDKDTCQTLSCVTGAVSAPFWLNDGSLGFFRGREIPELWENSILEKTLPVPFAWQIVQLPATALSSRNPLSKAKTYTWSTANNEYRIATNSHWAWEILPGNKGVFTELTSGQYSRVTVQLQEDFPDALLFKPDKNEFLVFVNHSQNPYYRLYSLDQPGKSEILLKNATWKLFFTSWVNDRYLLFRKDGGYICLLDTQTHQEKILWPVKNYNPLSPKYIDTCYFTYPSPANYGVLALGTFNTSNAILVKFPLSADK
jgi:hypothetical protein